ncbi:MAG: sialate O-acetylesterase [Chitinophagaceae bacterium]
MNELFIISVKKIKICISVLMLLGSFFPSVVKAQDSISGEKTNIVIHQLKKEKQMDLYLLIGQSNMAGRGSLTEAYENLGNENVLMLNKENNWVPAKHPLHFDKPKVAGVGPGLSFGIAMAKKNRKHTIGLIPCAVGGTSINVWQPGGYDKATNTHPYDDMLLRLNEAIKNGTLKGVIWLQGESDSSPEKAATYLSKLETLIQRLRQVVNNPSLPFVAGELGQYKEEYQNINKELAQLPKSVAHTAVATSEGLSDKGDQTHFDSRSADEYGKRFAKKMKALLKKKNR